MNTVRGFRLQRGIRELYRRGNGGRGEEFTELGEEGEAREHRPTLLQQGAQFRSPAALPWGGGLCCRGSHRRRRRRLAPRSIVLISHSEAPRFCTNRSRTNLQTCKRRGTDMAGALRVLRSRHLFQRVCAACADPSTSYALVGTTPLCDFLFHSLLRFLFSLGDRNFSCYR